MSKTQLGWHLLPSDRRLRHSDGRIVTVGKKLSCTGEPAWCGNGMHAAYNPSGLMWLCDPNTQPWICRVRVNGVIDKHDHVKFVGKSRTVLAMKQLTRKQLGRWWGRHGNSNKDIFSSVKQTPEFKAWCKKFAAEAPKSKPKPKKRIRAKPAMKTTHVSVTMRL